MNINSISFGYKYHFLQNQTDLICAYCGKKILSEKELNQLDKKLEGKRGAEIAEILEPYREYFPEEKAKIFDNFISMTKKTKLQNATLKEISLHLSSSEIKASNPQEVLRSLLNPILYSVEHVCPRSTGGINTCYNYLPMHISCNSDRSSFSYGEIMAKNPNFAENIKKSIMDIQARIDRKDKNTKNKVPDLPDDYSKQIQKAINQQGINLSIEHSA